MKKFDALPLAKMFSILILMIAFVVSSAIQSVKYYQSKVILDQELASKAQMVLDLVQSEKSARDENIQSKELSYRIIDPASGPADDTQMRILSQIGKKGEATIRTDTHYIHAVRKSDGKIAYVSLSLGEYHAALRNLIVSSLLLWLLNITILLTMINFLFKRLIVNRIQEILGVIDSVSQGNFIDEEIFDAARLRPKSRNEIDQIYLSLYRMTQSLKPVLEDVIQNSKEVVFESLYGYGKVKDNVSLIRRQNEALEMSNSRISAIMQMGSTLEHRLQELLEKAENSMSTVEEGVAIVNGNIDSTGAVMASMQQTIRLVEELRQFAGEISTTLSRISDIANETNLISLNAAIEAARAGEHGRGFAVVAEKIRELADISLQNASEINSVIGSIHANIENVSRSANRTNEIIQALNESSEVLHRNFSIIDRAIQDTGHTLKSFGEDFIEQEQQLNEVRHDLQRVHQSSSLLRDNSDVVEDSINAITEMSAHLQQVSDQFDVMVDKRASVRKLIVPPIVVHVSNGKALIDCYVYDISEGGISLIVTKKDEGFYCEPGAVYTLKTDEKRLSLDGRRIEMVYLFNKKDETTMRIGAKFV